MMMMMMRVVLSSCDVGLLRPVFAALLADLPQWEPYWRWECWPLLSLMAAWWIATVH